MSRVCAADLRDNGINIAKETQVQYLREQDVIGYAVENGMIDAGGISSFSGIARNWEKKGNRILHRSVKLPYFPMVASAKVPRADVEKLRQALLHLGDTDSGKEILQGLSVQGFVAGNEERLLKMLAWLGD
jgi:ABC-type phosphate/phosphonate transport system substrate-binding protein